MAADICQISAVQNDGLSDRYQENPGAFTAPISGKYLIISAMSAVIGQISGHIGYIGEDIGQISGTFRKISANIGP